MTSANAPVVNAFTRTFGTVSAEGIKQGSIKQQDNPVPEAEASNSGIIGPSYSISPAITSALQDTLDKIVSYKAAATPHHAGKQKFSSRIVLGKHTDIMPLVCSETGSVAALLFPAVPDKALIYRSPLAVFANAKGIALEGPACLRKLDAQTLAAILLTLAREYDLFRSAHSDTGAQKNAVLRTVERDTLIDAIILIAEHIHASNCEYLPKLSLILDVEVAEKGIHIRMQNWLKTVVELIYRPTAEAAEETAWDHPTPEKQITAPTISKANREKATLKKDFRAWAKQSKDTIIAIAAKGAISVKLKSFLLAVLTEDTITAADSLLIDLMAQKLESLNLEVATKLSFGLKKYHKEFNAAAGSDEFSSPNFASSAPGTPVRDTEEEDNEFGTTASAITAAAFAAADKPKAANSIPFGNSIPQTSIPQTVAIPAVSFAERIRMKREAAIAAAQESNTSEDQDAPF